jgi:hypothetical protein
MKFLTSGKRHLGAAAFANGSSIACKQRLDLVFSSRTELAIPDRAGLIT